MKNRLIHARFRIPMDLKFFAPDGGGAGQDNAGDKGGGSGGKGSSGSDDNGSSGKGGSGVTFTAEQLAEISRMLAGGAEAKENKTLQSYFKQQGMTEEEVAEAIKAYKAQRDASKSDVEGMTKKLSEAQSAVQKAAIREEAYKMCDEIGVNVKTMGYILKMADFKEAVGKDGKIDAEKVKAAVNQVIEDVPQLKPAAKNQGGFRQIGGDGDGSSGRGDGKVSLSDAVKEKLNK